MQMIRKHTGHVSGLCSCIFAVSSKDTMFQCVHALSQVQYRDMAHLLGPGKYNMNPKEAYLAGAKRMFRPSFTEEPPEAAVAVPFQVFVLQ